MIMKIIFAAGLSLLLSACATADRSVFTSDTPRQSAYISARVASQPVQCVPYARQQSGIQIMGDAYSWWDRAAPTYDRGHSPRTGSVLVLARTSKMKHGHVAVVTDVLGPRQINVTHSNWGNDRYSRRVIYDYMRVEDASAKNDWSSVRFWNPDKNVFGFPYQAKGFIYPARTGPALTN
jgi:surface antigen